MLWLDVAYCGAALFVPALPGWKMFESAEPVDMVVADRDGAPVDVAAWLPAGAQILERRLIVQVAAFVCRRAAERAPYTVLDRTTGRVVTLTAPRCEPDAP